MGLTYIEVTIANPGHPRRAAKVTLLVDSGAVYSVVPKPILRQLGGKPHSKRSFTLRADPGRVPGEDSHRVNGGAGGGNRTPMGLRPADFESAASTVPPLRRERREGSGKGSGRAESVLLGRRLALGLGFALGFGLALGLGLGLLGLLLAGALAALGALFLLGAAVRAVAARGVPTAALEVEGGAGDLAPELQGPAGGALADGLVAGLLDLLGLFPAGLAFVLVNRRHGAASSRLPAVENVKRR